MKKILLLSIFAVALMSFFGCKKDDPKDDPKESENLIANSYFTVANSTYQSGALPTATVSQSLGSVNMNNSVIPGGSSFITITTPSQMKEFYLSVNGVDGYLVVPASALTRADDNTYSIILLVSQNLDGGFTFVITGQTTSGEILIQATQTVSYVEVGTGALQVSLSFNNEKDVDLYVVRPDGEVIYYGNTGGYDDEEDTVWGLDLDSNPACDIDGVNNENIFFPTSQVLSGKYEVWVNMFANCDTSIATAWVITATRNGALITPSFGQNPAMDVFPIDTPSNPIDSDFNELAVKVMEFTITDGVTSVMSSYAPLVQLPSAIAKKRAVRQ